MAAASLMARLAPLHGALALLMTFLCWGVAGPSFKLVRAHPLARGY